MDTDRDTTRIVRSWLVEGRTALPDHILDAVLDQAAATPQRRPAWLARRLPPMGMPVRIAAAAAVILVAAVFGISLLSGAFGGVGGPGSAAASPSPSPTMVAPSPSPTPLPSSTPIDTASWTTYTSTRFGFSIGHPADWSLRPADHDWAFSKDAGDTSHPPGFTAWDTYMAADSSIAVSAWSVAVTPGTTVQSWLQAYCPIAESDSPCTSLQGLTIPVTVDGHAGSIVKFTEDTQAFFIVNDRMYVVASWRPAAEFDSLSTLQAFLSTMHLLPGGPASATPTP